MTRRCFGLRLTCKSTLDVPRVGEFSVTVLTTTGFGDFSAATPAGHALAVIEELTGLLYLVTVIGLMIGNFVGRRKTTLAPVW
jgi:uncharacterized membrane protein